MNKLYKKELMLTIVFTVVLMLMGHSASIFVAFPSLQQGTLWGFPIHYIIPILLGWFGVAGVSWLMAYYCNKLDDELDAYTAQYNETAAAKEEK
ncbi:MAG: hypothetical protein SCK29_01750 [Bacillota bacterium]|nr:hypothetical protein [Bacillota bacterium]MDW7682825.1 hypothetical protein [Bacillota bacterium]